jgi:phosphoesterase RecJ-like protein
VAIEPIEVERAAALIRDCRKVLVVGHENPDGDAIGSMLGMALMLEKAGKTVRCSWPGPSEMPRRYRFLPGWHTFTMPSERTAVELVVAVDCSNVVRFEGSDSMFGEDIKIINIDHHPDNTFFGYANVVDTKASAVAEILYLYADKLGLDLDEDAALCLYVGILTDTGRFQFGNTSETTLRVASEMVGMGVDPNLVFRNVYQSDSLQYLRLCGHVLSSAIFDESLGLIYGSVTQEEMKSRGVTMDEIQNLIDYLRTLKGHSVAALFKELQSGYIHVSLRSGAGIDVGSIARRLGGGGHRAAAAYTSEKKGIGEALAELRQEIVKLGRNPGDR